MEGFSLTLLAAGAGLLLGSYAVTAGIRFARSEPSSAGRSRCDSCGVSLGFAQTAPVASYLVLRGACARCGARIDPIHLAGEIAGALVLAAAVAVGDMWRTAILAAMGLVLIAASAIDIKVRRLPDVFTGAVAACAIALSAIAGKDNLIAGLIAAMVATVVLMAVRAAGTRLGREPGLGLGDVKLIAALALWLGVATPAMVALSALLGLTCVPLLRDQRGRLAFGPMIAFAAWVVGIANEMGWRPWAL